MRKKAIQLLTRREHSRQELTQKLLLKNYPRSEIDELLDALAKENLQSDFRFATTYVESRIAAGFGPVRISLELEAKGISDLMIKKAMAEIEVNWETQSQRARQKKFKESVESMQKQNQFLVQRGFVVEIE